MGSPFAVYILRSKTSGRFYVGHTDNLLDRLTRHNAGRSLATKGKGPFELVHVEYYSTRAQAAGREREIKARKSRHYIERLFGTSRA